MRISDLYNEVIKSDPENMQECSSPTESVYDAIDAYNDWLSEPDISNDQEAFEKALDYLEEAEYTKKDVKLLLNPEKSISGYRSASAKNGLFVSAMIKEAGYEEIQFPHPIKTPKTGYLNQADITVEGDVASSFASKMKKGELNIAGKAETGLGNNMSGGKIVVGEILKDTEEPSFGKNMEGGQIIVEGDSYSLPGEEMEGGQITIKGDSAIGSSIEDGTIHIMGDADGGVLHQKGGEIIIEGNVKRGELISEEYRYAHNHTGGYMKDGYLEVGGVESGTIGTGMEGGKIVINDHVGPRENDNITASGMEGGQILIKGDFEGQLAEPVFVSPMTGGEIIVEGDAYDVREDYGIGSLIEGGSIEVQGSAGSLVGTEMSGGNIQVEGNVGDALGTNMADSTIEVKGSAGDLAGQHAKNAEIKIGGNAGDQTGKYSRKSRIKVDGNAGNQLGYGLSDGRIYVKGDAGSQVGQNMLGGAIAIGGSAKTIEGMKGGYIQIAGNVEDIKEVAGGEICVDGEIQNISKGSIEEAKIYQKQKGEYEEVHTP
jgi:formylmethanofuran dehydrogenase subunit C